MTDIPQWAVKRGMNLWSDIKEDFPHPSRDLDLLDETAPYIIARALAEAAKQEREQCEERAAKAILAMRPSAAQKAIMFDALCNVRRAIRNNPTAAPEVE